MRAGPRTIRWRKHEFFFETLAANGPSQHQNPVWAVSWRGEFIGTMPVSQAETTKEFELRAIQWLADLLR